jgi:hypothetical protein
LASIHADFSDKIKGAYFIHSAGYVNLSTDEVHRIKFSMKTLRLQKIFNLFHPFIKFIYIGTAFSSGERKGLIENDFHNLDFIPEHRNAYENAKFHSVSQIDVKR